MEQYTENSKVVFILTLSSIIFISLSLEQNSNVPFDLMKSDQIIC